MRRSCTTIIYDALAQDQAWTLWYEPLAAANNPAIGGGSQARDVAVFADLRVARQRFAQDTGLPDTEELNFGAPRDTSLEFLPHMPCVIKEYLHENLPEPTDLERILLVWKYTFQRVRDALPSTYGNRGIMVRHEDFCANPVVELGRMYSLVERKVTEPVVSWACSHLRKPAPIHCDGDQRWRLALERMKMVELVQACGYEV